MERNVVFCGNLKSLRIRRFCFCGKSIRFHKSDYGNESIKSLQPFFDALAKKNRKFEYFFQKKEGFYEITENITNKQEIHFDYF